MTGVESILIMNTIAIITCVTVQMINAIIIIKELKRNAFKRN